MTENKNVVGRLFVKSALLALLMGAPKEGKSVSVQTSDRKTAKTELPVMAPVAVKTKAFCYDRVKLNEYKDIETLFNKALPLIFTELCLEEPFATKPYDDHGLRKGKLNTVGIGSVTRPKNIKKDWNNPNANWLLIAKHSDLAKDVTEEEALLLSIGWSMYRQNTENDKGKIEKTSETVLKKMFKELKGAEFSTNEFSALFCACYNNESLIDVKTISVEKGKKASLCQFARDNYKYPRAVANKIATWYKGVAHNSGTKDRCKFEAFFYLNAEDFCESALDMQFRKGKASCINVRGIAIPAFNKDNVAELTKKAKAKYLAQVYNNKDACTPRKCITATVKTRLGKVATNITAAPAKKPVAQDNYDKAISEYSKGNYDAALKIFLQMEKDGTETADLYNDIALTYKRKNNNTKCIEYCQKVLKTVEHGEYAKACYNAGHAYMEKGDYDGAIRNFEYAVKHFEKYGVDNPAPGVDYKSIYQSALDKAKAEKAQKAVKNQTTTKGKKGKSR